MTFSTVLPSDSTTVFEFSVERATDINDEIAPAIQSMHGLKYARPLNATVAPWLVHEYGLGPISQFFGSMTFGTLSVDSIAIDASSTLLGSDQSPPGNMVERLIDEGRAWQKLRGTPAALTTSLSWIQYQDLTIEDQVRGRRRWHLYQLGMGELPGDNEVPRLLDAEYLAGLSDPARSFFWRGYHGYDVRGHVWGRSRIGRSMWGDSSGVRVPGGKTKWSHGRQHQAASSGDYADTVSLGIADFGY